MGIKNTINKNLFHVYANVKYPEPAWRFFNRESVKKFEQNPPKLNEVQNKILSELKDSGIATTTLDQLFPNENVLAEFKSYAESRENSGSTNHKKEFLVDYWNEKVELDIKNPFLARALDPTILDIANSYMQMWCSLLYFTLQKTIPIEGGLKNSQNWHRDPQEKKVVKVFTYLNDVDEESGPFTYVKYSSPSHNTKYGKVFPQQVPYGSYPGNEKLESIVAKEDIIPMTGKAGTVIFCDTNGLHYGGVAKTNHRLMSTFGYSAHTYRENNTYYFDREFLESIKNFPIQSQHAIRKQWMRT